MKKFIKQLLIFIVCILLLDALLCIVIDPFNVFHPYSIRDNGVEPNKNYIKMKYVLANPDQFDSFLFGSSRVGNIHVENFPNEKCYNMTYSNGTPSDHLLNIRTLIENGIIPKHIYIGIDESSYMEDFSTHAAKEYRSPYEYSVTNPLNFWAKYFVPTTTGNSIITSLKYHFQIHPLEDCYSDIFYQYGWNYDYDFQPDVIVNSTEQISAWHNVMTDNLTDEMIHDFSPYGEMEQTLKDIAEICRLCDENGINLTVFTNPIYYEFYTNAVSWHYLIFLQRLVQITPFINFSGFNTITTDESYYMDKSHYNAYAGDLVINCLSGRISPISEEWFGSSITVDNIDDLIQFLIS